ncbi:hypothetical protein [Pseudonocardia sp.]|uniref:hypothetical protein n=1 Tax=Pseudonocardia sp. TaxID=60912 RepID=UPI00262FE9FE|nr:hypothetical protein [Pseudonocardia sp.]
MNDPVRLPAEVVRSWVEEDAQLIRTEMAEAEQGSYTDRPNAVESLVWLGAALPDLVDWEPLLDLLAHPLVRSRTKRRLCFRLARAASGLPSAVTERLRELVPSIVGSPADRHLVDTMGGAIAHLAITLNVDGLFDTQSELLVLLGAETQSRVDAAIMIGLHPAAAPLVPVLLALVHDDRQEIRAASATGLAHHLIRTPDSPHPAAFPALTAAVASGGGQPALDVVSTFAGSAHVPASCGDLLGSLSEHPSARVRNIVVGLVDGEDVANPPDSSAR